MRSDLYPRAVVLCCALAATMTFGCARDDRDTAKPNAAATAGEGTPVTLTGCLQKRDKLIDTYVLSDVRDEGAVGTSGADQPRVTAALAYRLVDADKDDLEANLGKRVRVTGRLQDAGNRAASSSELGADPKRDTQRDAQEGTAARPANDLEPGDLPAVKTESITQVADACGMKP